jgi:hypothetical protein
MKFEKKLQKFGEGLMIYFSKREIEIFKLKNGMILDLSDMFIKKRDKKE